MIMRGICVRRNGRYCMFEARTLSPEWKSRGDCHEWAKGEAFGAKTYAEAYAEVEKHVFMAKPQNSIAGNEVYFDCCLCTSPYFINVSLPDSLSRSTIAFATTTASLSPS